jgi:hypothetical protein
MTSDARTHNRTTLLQRCAEGEFDGPYRPRRDNFLTSAEYEAVLLRHVARAEAAERRFFDAVMDACGLSAHRRCRSICLYVRDRTRGQERHVIIDAFFELAEVILDDDADERDPGKSALL